MATTKNKNTMKIGGHDIIMTHENKLVFPNSGISKGDVIDYYKKIANYMLPYLQDRPLTLHRFPKGIRQEGFYQKNASDYFPDWIKTIKIKKKDGWVNHVICDTKETLVYLANQGTITFHIALSKIDKLEYPDKLIFDLDPPNGAFGPVIASANTLRLLLESELGLTSYPMLTGSSGIHIVVSLDQSENFDGVRAFAKNLAGYLAKKYPKDFTIEMRKDQRKGRLFLDYLRNSYAQTAVCPFSVRAFEGAPVATPIDWEELENGIHSSKAYNINTIFDGLTQKVNPWKDFDKHANNLSGAKKELEKLIERPKPIDAKNIVI